MPAAPPAVCGDEPGADDGRLPASRRADDGHEATVEELVEDRSHDLLSTEEEVVVFRPERDQSAVRARRGARRDRQSGCDDRPPRGQLCQADLRRKPAVDTRGSCIVDENLSWCG